MCDVFVCMCVTCVQAPKIVLPENVLRSDSLVLVVDLGHLSVRSDLKDRQADLQGALLVAS